MPIHALGEHTPELPPTGQCWVAPGAHVIGQVRLGADVGVWFGAVLRGDNAAIEVGARTNIQENAVLHVDPGTPLSIGEGVTVGHGAIVHGCTVGNNVLVGMGAVVMNRAVIGADSLVAAAAVVTEGKMFPPGSLIVGSPARVVRALTETEIAGLRRSAAHYVENWKRFAREMT
ncbi:MAG: gamma carbonic anhydrase family protein [Janthinobacterium lividum]